MRPVRSPIRSTTGLAICSPPRYVSTLPYSATSKPGVSWRSRHGWLKNTTCIRPVPSPTTVSTIVRLLRPMRLLVERTDTSTSASVPGTRSLTRASLVRSTQRRGYVVSRSSTVSTPTAAKASRLRSPTPRSLTTGMLSSSRRVSGLVSPSAEPIDVDSG